jgi:acyl-homoserine lactone acylase PvdQ
MRKRITITFVTLFVLLLFIPLTPVYACRSWNRKKITIIRDDYGVPHVFANTKEGLAFGAGYAMAQDRLWQADIYR